MIRYDLPDETVIEVAGGSNLPPGASGQHVSRTHLWYRINSGEWRQTFHRTMLRFAEWVECCETFADFLEGERDA